ncbi:uncharacterized protein LOC143621503 [Bidens hawaiensis]|uniref:uncharacterized protein LOC143621503 n=1 Tax=Bidens hawaiensis TaxID=980011 RepID=UPI00404AD3CA
MDCNKEEALRAKQLAEKKMEIKDFSGALKIAVKAQNLYPELENISQLILVCEVHCSAEKKSYGTDKDWYGILKVEPNADEISIKKQYRKLALTLHPDKNKFAGSTDAFKLIGEAQRVLLDRDKRMVHDSKRRTHGHFPAPGWNPTQPPRQSNVQYQHPWNQGHTVNFTTGARPGNFQYTPAQFTSVSGHQLTFWTVCPFCSIRYQFYKDVLNKAIHCQSCKKSFTAYELNAQSSASTTHTHIPTRTQQTRVHPKPKPRPAEVHKRNFTTKPVFEKKKETPKAQVNTSRKRKKRIEESSESSDSSESLESEEEEDVEVQSESEDNGVAKNVDKNQNNNSDFQYFGEQPRRSSRAKRNVSYKENIVDNDNDNDNDNDDATPSNPAEEVVEDKRKESSDKKSQSDSKRSESVNDDGEETEPEVFECPDPEFSNFDQYRTEESFKPGQIWGCYDTEDAMPRFYAFIKKVFHDPEFKLQIQWLKPDPVTVDEKKWVSAELPVACGGFKFGKSDNTGDLFTFSHLVTCEAGQKVKTFNIIPRKGETWALFKNWSINWHSEDSEERKYEYEFVEVLTDFDENEGARVAYLKKVKGFVCLFRRKEGGEMVICGNEKYRFAHMAPSSRMSGEEREGVPKGCFELDPAALPASVFE